MTTDMEKNEVTTHEENTVEKCSVFKKENACRTFSDDGWSRWDENSWLWWINYKSYNCIYGFFSYYSISSWFSLFSLNGIVSVLVFNGMWSLLSFNSIFSILSMNSTFSILGRNSSFSIGCTGEDFKICFGNDED